MMRMLRLDKFTTAALEATFREYLDEKNAWASTSCIADDCQR